MLQNRRILNIITLCFLLISLTGYSQATLSSNGKEIRNGSGSLNQTIGEAFTLTFNNNERALTQGFNQPPEIESSEDSDSLVLNEPFALYPNPAHLSSTISTTTTDGYTYSIYDIRGRLLQVEQVPKETIHHSIDISKLAYADYIIKIKSNTGIESNLKLSVIR